jgi:hypothetical protein
MIEVAAVVLTLAPPMCTIDIYIISIFLIEESLFNQGRKI